MTTDELLKIAEERFEPATDLGESVKDKRLQTIALAKIAKSLESLESRIVIKGQGRLAVNSTDKPRHIKI